MAKVAPLFFLAAMLFLSAWLPVSASQRNVPCPPVSALKEVIFPQVEAESQGYFFASSYGFVSLYTPYPWFVGIPPFSADTQQDASERIEQAMHSLQAPPQPEAQALPGSIELGTSWHCQYPTADPAITLFVVTVDRYLSA